MELVIAEKPSVAQSIAAVLGATQRKDGYLEGNDYLVSWCVGHLVELVQPEQREEFNEYIDGVLNVVECNCVTMRHLYQPAQQIKSF